MEVRNDKKDIMEKTYLVLGTLLDIMQRRGKRGMETLMTALEYIEPDVFFKLTKREPRPPTQGEPFRFGCNFHF